MSDRLFALRLFCRVARTGSFSKAGREFVLSQPSVSRIMATLEQEVGATLLIRTTRAVTLTEAGQEYLDRAENILSAVEEADHAARGTGELRGTLRVGVATSFAIREVVPRLPPFMSQHPALKIDLVMTDTRQDLIHEGVDVALRFGVLTDSSAHAKRLGSSERLLVASPDYLRRAGTPTRPTDLPEHALIIGPGAMSAAGWSFRKNGKTNLVRVEGRLQVSVNEVATVAAVAGLGILSTGDWGCRAELNSGSLVRVLSEWEMDKTDVHALFTPGRAIKASARAFADYLAEGLRTA